MQRNWRKQLAAERSRVSDELVAALSEIVGPENLRRNEPLSRHTTYRIGGPADIWLLVPDREALARVQATVSKAGVPLLVMGGGANILVQDGGVRGVVIKLGRGFDYIHVTADGDDDVVEVGAATMLGYLIKVAKERGWQGVAPIAGTPGSVGGGLKMNAGDREVWLSRFVESVDVVLRDGSEKTIPVERIGYDYRSSKLPPGAVVVGGRLRFRRDDVEKVRAEIEAHISKRKETQPLNMPNGGSVFRNPAGNFAGELIERVGLKGVRLHQVQFSPKHANFIVNLGGGRARDVLALIRMAKDRVYKETGVRLEEELVVVGEELLGDEELEA